MPDETPPHVTLLIPGLLGLPEAAVPVTRTRRLARANRHHAALPAGFETRLFRLFGIPTPAVKPPVPMVCASDPPFRL